MTLSQSDLSDIQGLIVRGYGQLPAAGFLLMGVRHRDKAAAWLRERLADVTFAETRPETLAMNIALSHHGLIRLGIPETVLAGFSNEFRSGMTTPHKRRTLGDEGAQAPEHWQWGGPETRPVDVLLMCYARDDDALNERLGSLSAELAGRGLDEILRLDTVTLPEFREHFGFRDSIGQPYIAEFDPGQAARDDAVPLGEFVLGYRNGYGQITPRPLLDTGMDPDDILPGDAEGSPRKDLGLNGSYLVFRQLAQDVPGFWRTQQALAAGPDSPVADPVQLAANMVGRWPSGTPLVLAPDRDAPDLESKDRFLYHETDAAGLKCPLGAHIRRTNPRDSLDPEPGSDKSLAFSNRHRLLRRGRAYGAPFDPSLDPAVFLARSLEEEPPVERGLHFICLNANIGRQFEFVQHTWSHNPGFNGLRHETDPIIGRRQAFGQSQDSFTLQLEPLRYRWRELPDFVHTRGGGYFFLPGRRALRFLFNSHPPEAP